MNVKHKFRNFVKEIPIVLENRKYMALHSTRYDDEIKLPQSVNNFLNMVPKKYRTQVLRWIMTEGMRKASISRRHVANVYAKQYGLKIDQDQLFSPASYERDPKLNQLKSQIEQDWFDQNMEPRYIPIGPHGTKKIDAYRINAHLEDIGMEPMYFGGVNGLLQYVELGSWVNDQFHADSRDDKQGHDLSLPVGDMGIHSSTAKRVKELKEKIEKAELEGNEVEKSNLISDLRNLVSNSENGESEDAQKNITKLGLGRSGYVPSSNTTLYDQSIKKSAVDSLQTMKRLYADIQSGKKIGELDGDEARLLQKMIGDGKITSNSKKQTLAELLGVINRKKQSDDFNVENPETTMYAKGIIKAVFMDLLSRDPSDPGSIYKTFPTTNPAMGQDSTGFLKDATVSISKGKKISLTGANVPNRNNIEQIADQLTDWMVDDEKGLTTTMVTINRGYTDVKTGKVIPYVHKMQPSEFISASRGKKPKDALERLDGQPIQVNFKGSKETIEPEEIKNRLQGVESEILGFNSKQVDAQDDNLESIEIDPKDLKNVLKGFKEISKNKKGDVINYRVPNTNITKQIKVVDGENGKRYFELKPIENEVNADINDPKNKVEEFGGGKYARITFPDGYKIRARRSVDKDGKEFWHKLDDLEDAYNDEPLLHLLNVKVNSGIANVKTEMRYDDDKTKQMWNDFLKNWEMFGEPNAPRNNVPECIIKAVRIGKRDMQADDPINLAQVELMNQIANPSFIFGDFKTKAEAGRQRDVYDLLNEFLSPEETEKVVSFVKSVLFRKPGSSNQKRVLVSHDKDDLIIPPNSVRKDVYEALLKNGFDWRVRKAVGSYRSLSSKDPERIARGEGGADSDEVKTIERGVEDDDYDDELYSADDQDDILLKRGEKEFDPDKRGLNIMDLEPGIGGNYIRPNRNKRDIHSMYATKIGDDDESNYFVSGRKRTNFNRTPENFKASSPLKNSGDWSSQINPSQFGANPAGQSQKGSNDWMSLLQNFQSPEKSISQPTKTSSDWTSKIDPNKFKKMKKESVVLKGYEQWLLEKSNNEIDQTNWWNQLKT